MKKQSSIKHLLLLIALMLTVHISYGQSKPDSTDQYSIRQSRKCFNEQKSLKIILEQKDSIIMEQNKFIKNTEPIQKKLIEDNNKLGIANSYLDKKLTSNKVLLKVAASIAIIEAIVITIIIIAK